MLHTFFKAVYVISGDHILANSRIFDVFVYSSFSKDHIEHIRIIINAPHQANMKIFNEKSHFFQNSVEYLGRMVKYNNNANYENFS